jgi:hypothetical protein
MSLVTLAVVSAGNVPLYLRDFVKGNSNNSCNSGDEEHKKVLNEGEGEGEESESSSGDDPFGFFESTVTRSNASSSLKHQVSCRLCLSQIGMNVISILSVCYQYVISMLSVCYQYVISMLSVCYRYVVIESLIIVLFL